MPDTGFVLNERAAAGGPCAPGAHAAFQVIDMLADFVGALDPSLYARASLEGCAAGSIGAHVRHCLDHFASLQRGLAEGVIDYDARERDPLCEARPEAALSRLAAARAFFAALPAAAGVPLRLRALLDARSGATQEVATTLERECLFVASHCLHHMALIKILAHGAGLRLPDDFGKSPSTIRHQGDRA